MPSPLLLKNIRESIALLIKSIQLNRKILIVGDYDVDGISSTALLVRFLKEINYDNIQYFIPSRFEHGYGLTEKALPPILAMKAELVITVDTGITAKKEIGVLLGEGIDVIVTDHHSPQDENIPDCLVINPKLQGCQFPFKNISGVGVAYLFLVGLRMELRNQNYWPKKEDEPNLMKHLDLVALGTVADQVPLVGLNRIFVRYGLEQMTRWSQSGYAGPFFHYLKVFAEKHRTRFFNCETIGFYLGPLLNAAGRLKDASTAIQFLLSASESEADQLLNTLEKMNIKRRQLQQKMARKAQEQADQVVASQQGLLIYDESFHEGLIGIIANRLSEQYHLPAIVGTKDDHGVIKYSCRSKHLNILEILKSCEGFLSQYGGHANAAGCCLREDNLSQFNKRFYQVCSEFGAQQKPEIITTDIEITLDMANAILFEQLKILEPFGQENRRPLLMLSNLSLPAPLVMTGKHLKWHLRYDLEMMFWKGVNRFRDSETYTVACTIGESFFQGERKTQLVVKALSPSPCF